jgi:hypothetical protein
MFFSAKLLFELRTLPQAGDEPLKEERIVLIDALEEVDAQQKAVALGKESEHQYEASDGGAVSVVFLGCKKVYYLNTDNIDNFTELYSEYI